MKKVLFSHRTNNDHYFDIIKIGPHQKAAKLQISYPENVIKRHSTFMLIVKNVLTFTKTFLKLFPSRVIYTDEKIEIVACNSCSFMIENVFKNFA